jgi:hypothetical protein
MLKGASLGIVDIVGEDVTGFEGNVVNVVRGNVRGVQHGVVNVTIGNSMGAQIGVTNFIGSDQGGVQVGVVNYATNVKGVQLGVVNVAEEAEGIPIGLVSVVLKGGQTHGQTWFDEMGFINFGFIHGSKTVYNIYTAAVDINDKQWAGGLGLGVHIPVKSLFVNIEGVTSYVLDYPGTDLKGMLNRFRTYVGYSPIKQITIIGGVSFNHLNVRQSEDFTLTGYEFGFSSGRNHYWPGLFIGLQF